jgi:hypothetical protein
LVLPAKDLEASGLHTLKHLGDACLDAEAASFVCGVVRQHLQTVRAVLLRQLVARALIVLETIVGPCTGYPIAQG